MSPKSWTPTTRSNRSVETKYFSQSLHLTQGNCFLVGRSILLILTGADCPNSLKTRWAPDSDRCKLTFARACKPFDLTRVNLACRITSRQETSASNTVCRRIGDGAAPMACPDLFGSRQFSYNSFATTMSSTGSLCPTSAQFFLWARICPLSPDVH